MKLTESRLRQIIREELAEYGSSISQSPEDYSQTPRRQEEMYQEIINYLDRNGRQVKGGYEIGDIVVGVTNRNPLTVSWTHQPGGRWVNDVKIGPNGELEFIGAGGATPRRMPDYYDGPETIIDLLQSDKRTVTNYPT